MDEPNVKKKKKKKSQIPLRLNLLFLVIFLAFSGLILRLGYIQIVKGEDYAQALSKTQNKTASVSSARGLIYDSTGKLLVDNKAKNAIVFTRKPSMDAGDLLNIAKKLKQYITVSTSKHVPDGELSTTQVTDRDKKDFLIAKAALSVKSGEANPIYKEKLTANEMEKMKPDKQYQAVIDRITPEDINQIKGDDLKVAAIWRKLEQASNLSPAYIKIGLSQKELALIGEHLNEFDGSIDTTVAATRDYPDGHPFFLGNVKEIPRHEINNYLAEGYNRNDLVGTSNLEQEYEDVLRGVPTTYEYTTKNGQPVGTPKVTEGRRGDDLVLTIDMDLQKKIGKILDNRIKEYRGSNAKNAYAVVINPRTGAILAMNGRKYDASTGKFEDDAQGTVFNAYQIGSSAKMGTEMAGFQNNAMPGCLYDKPVHYKGGGTFKSWSAGIGTVCADTALKKSSNVYMGRIAANMAGFQFSDAGYGYNVRVFNGSKYVDAVNKLRDVYHQFGLGVQTGIDLPFESTGFDGGVPDEPGKIMQFAIGQFDTYTPIQMAQYASAIANGGYRITPHLLDSIHRPGDSPKDIGPTLSSYQTKVLNKISNPNSAFETIHKGLIEVTQPGGTGASFGQSDTAKFKIAAKTGTAQVNIEKNMYNLAVVSYAPYDDPQIAVVVMVPNIHTEEHINLAIAKDIYKAYFAKYPLKK
ncbi:peptidoglycan D,D-transpeptidase FtsI family protein [Camelliibacillus cellulosilyticus]|uniref:Peptidoglycan D,D-transpeptidase FtsI family protein n=1 Tax=Camelliibacillus cellulosilyticus TaxID=2174486 RepID=A0ABV9GJ62_9BACL